MVFELHLKHTYRVTKNFAHYGIITLHMEDGEKCSVIFFWSLLCKKTCSIIAVTAVYGDGDIPVPTGAEISRTDNSYAVLGRKKKKTNNLAEDIGSLPYWKYFRTVWTESCAMSCRMTLLEQGG